MRTSQIFSKMIILLFFMGMVVPKINNTIDIPTLGVSPDIGEIYASDSPEVTSFVTKKNYPPTLLSPSNGAYINDITPTFDWKFFSTISFL